jgi:glyoxylase-like metal-dependent hydrolase (beta-lactamase superfamily II)
MQPTNFVDEGAYIGSLRVIGTRGHTPGHISFLDTRDGSLLAGDALQTQGGIAVAGVIKAAFPIPALATWNRELSYQSAMHLRAFRPERLAPGHGKVMEDCLPAMDAALREAERELRPYRAA